MKSSITKLLKAGAFGSAGATQLVWNNGGAGRNYNDKTTFGVFQNSNYGGHVTFVPPLTVVNLQIVQNDNASMKWW